MAHFTLELVNLKRKAITQFDCLILKSENRNICPEISVEFSSCQLKVETQCIIIYNAVAVYTYFHNCIVDFSIC